MSQITEDTLVTGAEFKDFYLNHWPDDYYIEEMPYEAEDERGNWVMPDDEKRPLSWFGVACYQGDKSDLHGHMRPMHEFYAEVMGKRTNEPFLSFRVPADRVDAMKAAAEELGATLI